MICSEATISPTITMAVATLPGFPYSVPQQVSVTYQPPEKTVFPSSLCCHLHLLPSNPWNASDFQSSLFLLSSTERGFCISKCMWVPVLWFYCSVVCTPICVSGHSATQEVLWSSAWCDQFCTDQQRVTGGKGFVSS